MSTEPDVFNPYPGLRPFEADENHLFFGRDGQSNELLRRLRRNRFLAVVGTSGCGKSSLVRAGLLADLHGGMMAERSSRWRIALFRPGADPVGNLAVALCRSGVLLPDEAESTDSEMERAFMTATLKRSALGIVEACGQHQLPEGSNLLIVVDQFEELFRFKEAGSVENASDEAAAFVKLLLSAAKHPDVPIYVIITMRSDFLGDCTQFRDLPETINDGQYLVPRMTRAERRAAIAGPAAVGGATITPGLVQRLLNDVGDNPDQLPILQHALMRTWDHWQARDPQGQPIDLPDYEAIGGMRDALSRHADEAFAEIAEDQSDQQGLQRQWIAEKLFKFLSEKGTDNREIRHPGKLADIAAAAGVEASELISVIEVFRKAQRSFLMPPASEKLKPETQIDISHESLIRNWGRLKRWVEEESNSAAIYRRLVERAALYREGREVLLTDPALYSALEWREREQPNAAWARRYHPDFEQSIGFLEESDRAFKAEQAAREERARREEVARRRELEEARELASARKAMVDAQSKAARNSRRFAVVFFVLFVAAAVSGIFGWIRNEEAAAHREYDTIREVAEFAKDESGGNPEKAGLIAIEALKAIVKASKIDNFRAHRRALALDAVFHLDAEKPKVAEDQLPEVAEALRQALRNLELNGRRLSSGRRVIRNATFSEDAKEIVAVDSFGTVQRWDALNLSPDPGNPIDQGKKASYRVKRALFSPDAKQIVVEGSDHTLRILDTQSLEEIHKTDFDGEIAVIAFSHDKAKIAIAIKDGPLLFWHSNTEDGKKSPFANNDKPITSLVFSPDDEYIASADQDGTISVWNSNAEKQQELKVDKGSIYSLEYSADGTLLACGTDQGIRIYELRRSSNKSNLSVTELNVLKSGTAIEQLTFNPQRNELAAYDGHAIRLWKYSIGYSLRTLSETQLPYKEKPTTLVFSPDGKYLLAAGARYSGRYIALWNSTFPEELPLLTAHADAVKAVGFQANGNLVTASDDGSLRFRSVDSGAQSGDPIEFYEADGSQLTYGLSNDGQRFATVDRKGNFQVRSLRIDNQPLSIEVEPSELNAFAFEGDSTLLATAGSDRVVKVWKFGEQDNPRELHPQQEGSVTAISFDSGGKRIAVASSKGSAEVRKIESDELIWSIPKDKRHKDQISVIAFSPDGKQLVTIGKWNKIAKVWDLKTDDLWEVQSFENRIVAVSFSLDSSTIAFADDNGKTTLWNIATRKRIFILSGHIGPVHAVAFSPDGKRIATAGDDGTVRLYAATAQDLLKLAQARFDRTMTLKECKSIRSLVLENCKPLLAIHREIQNAESLLEYASPANVEEAMRRVRKAISGTKENTVDLGQLFALKPLNAGWENDPEKIPEFWLTQTLKRIAGNQAKNGEVQSLKLTLKVLTNRISGSAIQTLKDKCVRTLRQQGEALVKRGKFGEAKAAFGLIQTLAPERDFDPDKEINKLKPTVLVSKGESLLRERKGVEALEKFTEAQSLNKKIVISARSWGKVCWYGVLQDQASKVLEACERSVESDPGNGGLRDSRGVAKAMTGQFDGVREDFEAYIRWAPGAGKKQERIDRRRRWIEQLDKKENPFSEGNRKKLIEELSNE